MIPDDIKIIFNNIYQNYIKQYMAIIVITIILLVIGGLSILLLGNNNVIEKDIEKIIETEINSISSSVS